MRRSKKKAGFRWGGDWAVLWVLGGLVLAYFAFIPEAVHPEVHPVHWLLSALGGVAGYGIGLFVDTGLPPLARFVRSRKAIVRRDGRGRMKRGDR